MNTNHIQTDGFSNSGSERLYHTKWPNEPELNEQYKNGGQCGSCSFFAQFNADWGLCCHSKSRHHLETVFEHFTCSMLAREGWGAHTFSDNKRNFCRCNNYLPLPENIELICLEVRVEQQSEDHYQAKLELNEKFSAEEEGIYFTLKKLEDQVGEFLLEQ